MRHVGLAAAVLLGVSACHSGGGAGGAPDAAAGNDASNFGDDDGARPDVGVPSTCPVLQQWDQLCNPGDACGAYRVAHCGAYDQYFSDGAREAVTTCYALASSHCDAGAAVDAASGLADVDSCLQQELLAAVPTAAQQKLAADYCARCSPSEATCAGSFYAAVEADAGVGGGAGAPILAMSDALVTQIDAACTGAALDAGSACDAAFRACASSVYAGVFPSLTCPSTDAGP